MLFDVTDYELVSNLVTAISSLSDDSHYPSAKAVYDFHVANGVDSLTATQVTSMGSIVVTITLKNPADQTIASGNVTMTVDTIPTDGSNNPVSSNAVYDALADEVTARNLALAGKQDTLTSTTITLASNAWSSNAQTVTGITNVTATNIVWVSPSSTSFDEYGSCGIRVTAQASGSLTFENNGTDPTNDLTVIVVGA